MSLKELTIEGEIRSIIPSKGGNNRFGIKFVALDDASSSDIRDFIKKNERGPNRALISRI